MSTPFAQVQIAGEIAAGGEPRLPALEHFKLKYGRFWQGSFAEAAEFVEGG